MHSTRFFDSTLALVHNNAVELALPLLAGKLHASKADERLWQETRSQYLGHPLHQTLLEDPYIARCVTKPRGYAGDAELIDMIYDQRFPAGTSALGQQLFSVSIAFPVAESVRHRRDYMQGELLAAQQRSLRVLSLACGHFREGDGLVGEDLSNVVLVDQDPLSLDVVRARHGDRIACHEANVFQYLRAAIARKERFDLVYTLGLTDYLDDRAMQLLHRMVKAVLNPGGTFLLANFLTNHLAVGWLDAVMDWHLIYRETADLEQFASAEGFSARTWTDPYDAIGWCEMQLPGA